VKLPEVWLEQIPEFLGSVPLRSEPDRALLHTEIMREHLVVTPGRWTLNGIFDFEPAMIGDRAHEFGAVGVFTSRGDPRVLGRIMIAYGRAYAPRELLAYLLLHVYSNLRWYLRILPPAAAADAGLAGRDLVRHGLKREVRDQRACPLPLVSRLPVCSAPTVLSRWLVAAYGLRRQPQSGQCTPRPRCSNDRAN
jgi:hypothetical protein